MQTAYSFFVRSLRVVWPEDSGDLLIPVELEREQGREGRAEIAGHRDSRWLEDHLVPRAVTWTFARPVDVIQPGDRLVVRTNCPGTLTWRAGDRPAETVSLAPVGGVMAGVGRCQITLGPFDEAVRVVRFRFRCAHPACDHRDRCCRGEEHAVGITEPRPV